MRMLLVMTLKSALPIGKTTLCYLFHWFFCLIYFFITTSLLNRTRSDLTSFALQLIWSAPKTQILNKIGQIINSQTIVISILWKKSWYKFKRGLTKNRKEEFFIYFYNPLDIIICNYPTSRCNQSSKHSVHIFLSNHSLLELLVNNNKTVDFLNMNHRNWVGRPLLLNLNGQWSKKLSIPCLAEKGDHSWTVSTLIELLKNAELHTQQCTFC